MEDFYIRENITIEHRDSEGNLIETRTITTNQINVFSGDNHDSS